MILAEKYFKSVHLVLDNFIPYNMEQGRNDFTTNPYQSTTHIVVTMEMVGDELGATCSITLPQNSYAHMILKTYKQ